MKDLLKDLVPFIRSLFLLLFQTISLILTEKQYTGNYEADYLFNLCSIYNFCITIHSCIYKLKESYMFGNLTHQKTATI